MGLERREALWAVKGLPAASLPLFAAMGEEERGAEPAVELPKMALSEQVVADYMSLRLSLKAHPVSFLRAGLAGEDYLPASALAEMTDGRRLKVAGLVLVRQRPGTAKGVIFATLEDETGVANVVVWADVFERHRATVLKAGMVGVEGRLQKEGEVIHVVAERLVDMTDRLMTLSRPPATGRAKPLEPAHAHADEVKRPNRDLDIPASRPSQLRRHPRDVNPLPRSRDFH